jgi:hypothetical protein
MVNVRISHTGGKLVKSGLVPDPRDLLSRFRATYRNHFTLSATSAVVPEGALNTSERVEVITDPFVARKA